MALSAEVAVEAEVTQWPRVEQARNRLRPVATPVCPRRILCFGGGTGLPTVLRGLSPWAVPTTARPAWVELTAVVAMSDDGGSSGRLRRSRGLLPPGDIRNCLVAMARRSPLGDLFQYRFDGGQDLAGHAVGNLLIAALAEQKGDFLEAVRLSAQLLGARGRVLPSTLAPVELVAEVDGEVRLIGEHHLAERHGRVRRVSLLPRRPPPVDGLLDAIAQAELIVYGPGSLYSSILPNLLVDGVAEALREARALRVLVSNLMTQPGETEEMNGEEHVRAVLEHAGPVVDVVLSNLTPPAPEVLRRYALLGSRPVEVDARRLAGQGVAVIEADLLKVGSRIRHDHKKLARCLLKLARSGI